LRLLADIGVPADSSAVLRATVFVKLDSPTIDYYRLLCVSRSASTAEIKAAYHRTLLIFHPDKQSSSTATYPSSLDISLIKDAYATLSSYHLRARYDAQLQHQSGSMGPRPAQIISLEEFEEQEASTDSISWCYKCRCGGAYRISEDDMDRGQHLIGCGSCSEVVWVGYKQAEDLDQDEL
jgi:diphthamide biosynthesis protein 4